MNLRVKREQGKVIGRVLLGLGLVVGLLLVIVFTVPLDVEKLLGQNKVLPHKPYLVSDQANELHGRLRVADWHADSLIWLRDLAQRSSQGQVDLPRLREGNVAIQVFTSVTKVPATGTQVENNPAEGDQITRLAYADKWPKAARKSIYHRAEYHARKLADLQQRVPEELKIILTQQDLAEFLAARANGSTQIGGLLGTEGLHPLEGKLANVANLYKEGYRVMGLQHFFDNRLGGSLHGLSNAGLTDFGKQVIRELNKQDIVIDVAHSSEAVVRDVLALSDSPVIVSHTGMRGSCDSPRNISDETMQAIAKAGGIIGIGYFKTAICEVTVESVVKHFRYAIDLLGVEHVSLGSDFDGSIDTPLDTSELAVLTHTMLAKGFSEAEIKAVMGENIIRFLSEQLPVR